MGEKGNDYGKIKTKGSSNYFSPIFQISDLKSLRSDLERDLRDCKAVIDRVSAILY